MRISVFYEHIAEAAVQTGKSVEEILDIIKSHGIQAVEIESVRLLNKVENITQKIKEVGMSISCIYSFFDFGHGQDVADGFKLIDLAVSVECGSVLLIPGFVQPREDRNKLQSSMKEAVRAICDYANGKNITVCMEDFDDIIAPFASMHELLSFMQDVPGLSCAFDTGNFLYSEENVEEALELLLPYIKHVHLKDRSLKVKDEETPKLTVKGRKLYSAAVGTGCIPMEKICHKLLENSYDKTFAIEHFGSQNQLEDMIKSAEWVKNHCDGI